MPIYVSQIPSELIKILCVFLQFEKLGRDVTSDVSSIGCEIIQIKIFTKKFEYKNMRLGMKSIELG